MIMANDIVSIKRYILTYDNYGSRKGLFREKDVLCASVELEQISES